MKRYISQVLERYAACAPRVNRHLRNTSKMFAGDVDLEQHEEARPFMIGLKPALAAALCFSVVTGMPRAMRAADCPPDAQVRIPQAPAAPLNIDRVKELLLAYKSGDYDDDVASVFTAARAHVEQRASQVTRPALVLDIDETSLSNWANINANNFGFIQVALAIGSRMVHAASKNGYCKPAHQRSGPHSICSMLQKPKAPRCFS
jgi:hypothetical protein